MLLELKQGIIYGPVNSRRLGWSLGINILPSSKKVCAFNCVYCQYGWTKIHKAARRKLWGMPSVKAVGKALKSALNSLPAPPAYITFSGNGEPTLHPDFNQIVDEVQSVRNQLAPRTKTAVLSNSALVTDKSVREALAKLDVKIMKLDCGSQEMFEKYNQPCTGIDLEDITEGLAQLSNVSIQTLVSAGKSGNLNQRSINDWIERLKHIKPSFVQLYTLDRDYPANDLSPLTREKLNQIKIQVQAAGLSAEIY